MLWMLTNGKTLPENDKAVNALHLRVQCDVCATPAVELFKFRPRNGIKAAKYSSAAAASVEATVLNAADAVSPPNGKKTQMRETRI
jgi:hypothetical protein